MIIVTFPILPSYLTPIPIEEKKETKFSSVCNVMKCLGKKYIQFLFTFWVLRIMDMQIANNPAIITISISQYSFHFQSYHEQKICSQYENVYIQINMYAY